MNRFPRITHDPAVMRGRPCIRGLRVAVGMVLGNLGAGVSIGDLLPAYPCRERDDVLEGLRFAAWLADAREIDFAAAE